MTPNPKIRFKQPPFPRSTWTFYIWHDGAQDWISDGFVTDSPTEALEWAEDCHENGTWHVIIQTDFDVDTGEIESAREVDVVDMREV